MKPNIELDIEELVLDGFAAADREHIGAAVQQELARLLADGGLPALSGDAYTPRLDGGQIVVQSGAKPAAVGRQIAQAVYGGINSGSDGSNPG